MSGFPSIINIELTNACNKNCFMCGRRKREREDFELSDVYSKTIDFSLLEKLAKELSGKNIMLQFHWDGEPTMYPRLGDALNLFDGNNYKLNLFDSFT